MNRGSLVPVTVIKPFIGPKGRKMFVGDLLHVPRLVAAALVNSRQCEYVKPTGPTEFKGIAPPFDPPVRPQARELHDVLDVPDMGTIEIEVGEDEIDVDGVGDDDAPTVEDPSALAVAEVATAEVEDGEKGYRCNVCGKKYQSERWLERHREREHND